MPLLFGLRMGRFCGAVGAKKEKNKKVVVVMCYYYYC